VDVLSDQVLGLASEARQSTAVLIRESSRLQRSYFLLSCGKNTCVNVVLAATALLFSLILGQ
jgi:hypothetical protein